MTRLSKILEVVAILLVAIAPVAKRSGAQSLGGMLAHKPVQRNAAAPQANTAGSQANTMSIWQARKAVVTGLKTAVSRSNAGNGEGYNIGIHPESIQVATGTIGWIADMSAWGFGTDRTSYTGTFQIDLRDLSEVEVKGLHGQYMVVQTGNRTVFSFSNATAYLGVTGALLVWATPGEAQAFADAVNRLSSAARGGDEESQGSAWSDFQQKAAAWRALPVKPAISEEVRQHRLLAEHAVEEKQFEEAVSEYEAGLEINSTWPEGHFNAALLYAELKYYSEAIHHMRAYLELVPDAADAQQARDQMIIWVAELKKAQ